MAEEDSALGRARRYARVGASVGGLAARLGAERMLGVKLDRSKHAADLRQALGGLKGPLMPPPPRSARCIAPKAWLAKSWR